MKKLQPRQLQILKLLSTGLTNKEIADVLNMKERTVELHIYNTYKNINVHSRVRAALFYINNFQE